MKTKLSKIFALMIVATMIVSPVAAQSVTNDPPPSPQSKGEYNFQPVDDVEVVDIFKLRRWWVKRKAQLVQQPILFNYLMPLWRVIVVASMDTQQPMRLCADRQN